MSQDDAGARPSQVTVAGWAVTLGSVVLLVTVFDTMSRLGSLDLRTEISQVLSSGEGRNLGLSVGQALDVLRWSLYVAGVAAAVTGILGIYVLQRNRAARLVLSVAAVPIALTAPFTGGFLGMLVAAGAAVLWTRPARDWFDGRAPRPAPVAGPGPTVRTTTPQPPPIQPPAPGAPQPPPIQGWGQVPPAGPWGSGPSVPGPPVPGPVVPGPPMPPGAPTPPPGWGGYPTYPVAGVGADPDATPRPVRAACIVTWIFTSLTAIAYVILGVFAAVNSRALLDLAKKTPGWDPSYSDATIIAAVLVVSVVFLFWCVATGVLAWFVWRRHTWAWIALLISTGVTALASTLLALPFSLAHVAATGAVLGLLLRRSVRDWFTGPRTPRQPGDPGTSGTPPADGRPPVW